jgi:hypothetical protein
MPEAPLSSPSPVSSGHPNARVTCGVLALAAVAMVAGTCAFAVARFTTRPEPPPPSITTVVAPSPNLLIAMRDLARLESLDLHYEKVIDLKQSQSRLWGMVEASDGLLLVAAVDVTMGVDLAKLRDADVTPPENGGPARVCLPDPEILSSRLDEAHTYVYRRSTDVLAKRDEGLEAQARKAAVTEVERAVREGDAAARARAQAERSIRALASELGVHDVDFTCP